MLNTILTVISTMSIFLAMGMSKPYHPNVTNVQVEPVHLEDKQDLLQFSLDYKINDELQVDEAYEKSKLAAGRKDNIDERGPYLQGDMVVHPEQLNEVKQGIIGSQYRWPKGQIPYYLDPSFTSSEQSVILQAIQEIQSKTCIRFIPTGGVNPTNYVYIIRGTATSGCWSDVGMQQGVYNRVNLQPGNPGCVYMGVAAHELVHAIGYYHEQSRTDRDSYVTINWSNIPTATQYNFNKLTATQVNPYGVSYDYGSIMHYSAYAFAINTNTPTIYPVQNVPLSTLGQRNGLSATDAQKINNMYSGIC